MKAYLTTNVYEQAIERLVKVYKEGHRVIVAFSAGKDSGIIFELAYEAAELTGNLPLEMWMRDEEIMFPGTFEYAERIAQRPDLNFHWLISGQPIINIFNRQAPYYWVFDTLMKPDQWMRQPPAFAQHVEEKCIDMVVNATRFPPPEGKNLYVVMGVRAAESRRRNMMITSAGWDTGTAGYSGKRKVLKERHLYPIYDWTTADVWKAIQEKGWDYNHAYDMVSRYGIRAERQRIAPPAMTDYGIPLLQMASKAWPEWFDRLSERLPGVRMAAHYGKSAVQPVRHPKETWEQCYQRTCVDEAPEWIRARASAYREHVLVAHSKHSQNPILEISPCPTCMVGTGSWKKMAENIYMGDPFLLKTHCEFLDNCQPEEFREGAGVWGDGKPVW